MQNIKCEIKYNFALLVNNSNQCEELNKKIDNFGDDNIKSWEDFKQLCLDKLNEKEDPKKAEILDF